MIQINQPDLERALTDLGEQQPVTVKKTPLAVGILEAAVRRWKQTGNPEAWRLDVPAINGSPSIRGENDALSSAG